jgi:hypothetical protein
MASHRCRNELSLLVDGQYCVAAEDDSPLAPLTRRNEKIYILNECETKRRCLFSHTEAKNNDKFTLAHGSI